MTITANDLNEMALEFGNALRRMDNGIQDKTLNKSQIIRLQGYISGIETSITLFLLVAKRSNSKVDVERFQRYVADVRSGARDVLGEKVAVKKLKVITNA
jgi:hypothetical protein